MTYRRFRPPHRAARLDEAPTTVPRATRADVLALIAQLAVPQNRREVDDFPSLAQALVREARRYGITVPAWLAAIAGYRQPPGSLAVLRPATETKGTGSKIVERPDAPSAMIVVGVPFPRPQ